MLVAVLLLLSTGCRQGLAFRQDDRLIITQPRDRAVVRLPFDTSWTAQDLPAGTRFVVLIDRTPPPAGEGLDWFARDDPRCRRDGGCPDAEYLRGLHVFVVDQTSLTVASVPRPQRPHERELHDVTVVLIDEEGMRLGETAATVTVEVRGGR